MSPQESIFLCGTNCMKLFEIIETIEKIAPPHLAASWDNCGLQVASLKKEINCLALCLDPSPASIKQSIDYKADLIVSHHPLLMQGRLPSTLDHYHEVLRLLFLNDVALYAAHTSLDINPHGPVGWLAQALQLQNSVVIEEVGEFADGHIAGYGLIGDLENPLNYKDLLSTLQNYIDLETATICGQLPKQIKRIAYCTGSGSSFMQKAHNLHADIYITGDVKYHSALETPLCTIDVGHHSLEEEMMRKFSLLLEQLLPKLKIQFVPSASPLRHAKVQI